MTIRAIARIHAEHRREVARLKREQARELRASKKETQAALRELKRSKGEYLQPALARFHAAFTARGAMVMRHAHERTDLARRIMQQRKELAAQRAAWPGARASLVREEKTIAGMSQDSLRSQLAQELGALKVQRAEGEAVAILRGVGPRAMLKKKTKPKGPAKGTPLRKAAPVRQQGAATRDLQALAKFLWTTKGAADQHQLRAALPHLSPVQVGKLLDVLHKKGSVTLTRRPFGPAEARMVKNGTHPAPIIGKQAITGATWLPGGKEATAKKKAGQKPLPGVLKTARKKATAKKSTAKKATTKKTTVKKSTAKKAAAKNRTVAGAVKLSPTTPLTAVTTRFRDGVITRAELKSLCGNWAAIGKGTALLRQFVAVELVTGNHRGKLSKRWELMGTGDTKAAARRNGDETMRDAGVYSSAGLVLQLSPGR